MRPAPGGARAKEGLVTAGEGQRSAPRPDDEGRAALLADGPGAAVNVAPACWRGAPFEGAGGPGVWLPLAVADAGAHAALLPTHLSPPRPTSPGTHADLLGPEPTQSRSARGNAP